MAMIIESDLVSAIKAKRVPTLRQNVSCADLSLQELEIENAIRNCDSMGKVDALVDKLIMYVALNKCRMNSEV